MEVYSEQVTQGGSIPIAQVENKYRDYALDYQYTDALAQIFRQNFQTILYTTNARNQGSIESGIISGVLSQIDGAPQSSCEGKQQ